MLATRIAHSTLLLRRPPPQLALQIGRRWLYSSEDCHMDDMTPEMRSRTRTNALNQAIEEQGRKAALRLFDEMLYERLADSHQLGAMLSSGEKSHAWFELNKRAQPRLIVSSRLALQLATTARRSARSCSSRSGRACR